VSLCGLAGLRARRPPSIHGPFERERVQERDGVRVAVDCEMAIVEVDHRVLVPMNRERANTGTPARSAKVA
jgi:hypothetical protein